MLSKRDMDPLHGTDRASAERLPEDGTGITHERCGFLLACPCWTAGAALRSSESDSGLDALAEAVSDSLAATTEGTDYAEAPEPSDEPGSPYVLRLTNELAARGVTRLSTPRTETPDD